jgi:small subunit ribosomal protein S3Ae
MAKARARAAARKVKDKWRSKNWYQILSSSLFDNVPIAETLSDVPDNLIGRITEVSLQDITNDFRKAHIKLYFRINKIEDGNAHTQFYGHTLTSDYLRRMIRRRKSRIDGVYDIETKDNALLRVKPFAITDKRIQNSQKKVIRNAMKDTIYNEGKVKSLNEFLRDTLDGKIGSEIYKHCKKFYPVKRIEIYKTEIIRAPTIEIEEKLPKKKEGEEPKEPEEKEVKKEPEKMKKKVPKKIVKKKQEKPKKKSDVKVKKDQKKNVKKKENKTKKKTKTSKSKTSTKKQIKKSK